MRTQYLNLMKKIPEMKSFRTTLSLKPFVAFLERKAAEEGNVRTPFFAQALSRIREVKGWDEDITEKNIGRFNDLFELVYFTLSAPVTDENDFLWALSEPLTPHIFFCTEGFYQLLTDGTGCIKNDLVAVNFPAEKAGRRINLIYALVLKRFYDYQFPASQEMKVSVPDGTTGLTTYYSIGFDTRFIDVAVDGPLPALDFNRLQLIQHSETASLKYLQQALPLESFRFSGFSIVEFRNVTEEYTVEQLKDVVVNLSGGQQVMGDVAGLLRNLLDSRDTFVTLLPMLKVNGRLVLDSLEEMDRDFQEACFRNHLSKETYLHLLEGFIKNPRLVIIDDVGISSEVDNRLRPIFQVMGIKSIVIVPVFFQKELVGVIEIFSTVASGQAPAMLAKLKPVVPLVEQLFQAAIHLFNLRIDNVIKDQFTTLHPSVHWRFNQAAWNFIQKHENDPNAVMESVSFPSVYPLYGAIDVRNSTVERNNALRNDLDGQLGMLEELLDGLQDYRDLSLLDEIRYKTQNWRRQLGEYILPEDEFRLFLFMEKEVRPLLELLRSKNAGARERIDGYLAAAESDGEVHTHRREMDANLGKINRAISRELEKMNQDIQKIYPCYFEKFRSDGVEYDIYIGQSITPQVEFFPFYLKNLRLVQLSSMAEIARKTAALKPQLSIPLETTQLIFINANTIDISFRSDERRFDVEGGYNVRYEMIKKRIDKVHIRGSAERLTQPGKIALIYSQQKDIDEYLNHIFYLQEKGLLLDDLEYLDLEKLQGLDGLKALRIGVKTD